MTFWKVGKFIKDLKEREEVMEIFYKHVQTLKTLFILLAANSNFPAITWIDYTNFLNNCKIIDKNLQLSTVDRVFIATKVAVRELTDNPERDMSRYEFYESLVRIA